MSTVTHNNWRRERPGNEARPRAAERDCGNEIELIICFSLTCSTAVCTSRNVSDKNGPGK